MCTIFHTLRLVLFFLACIGTALVTACSGPPASTDEPDASAVSDAHRNDASLTDASPSDAPPDTVDAPPVDAPPGSDGSATDAPMMPVDAAVVDAPTMVVDAAVDALVDAGEPRIGEPVLQDITVSLGYDFPGGRADPDPWAIGSGAAVGDVDGDGDLDVFLSRCDSVTPLGGPSVLLRNAGPIGGFVGFVVDPTVQAMFVGTCAHGAAFADYDGDDDLDLFVTLNGADRLLANNGSGVFTNVTPLAGVAGPANDRNSGAYFIDVNHDGLLDLFVLGHTTTAPPVPAPLDANRLYLNRGDGSFEDVSTVSGVAGNGSSQAIAFADLDNDGDFEIYVANDRFALNGSMGIGAFDPDSWLDPVSYDDRGVPSYQDRSASYGTDGMRSSMGVALSDLDDDGRVEILVSDWGSNHYQVWNPAMSRYDDLASSWNLAQTYQPTTHYQISWQAEFPDLDRDGHEEFMIINGSVYDPISCVTWAQLDYYLTRDPMLDTFVDITSDVSWPDTVSCPPTSDQAITGRGAVFADLDGDGDDDLLVTPFIEKYRFFRNQTFTGDVDYVRVQPRGTVSAPIPYGAVLVLERSDGVTVRRPLYAGGTLAQRFPLVEASLGLTATVTTVTLHWPSGYSQRLDLSAGFALNTTLHVVEPVWLTLSARVVDPMDPAPILTYRPVDSAGVFLGAAGAGRMVTATRSDGVPVTITDNGDGTYTAPLPHPGSARITVVRITDGGMTARPRLTVNYQ